MEIETDVYDFFVFREYRRIVNMKRSRQKGLSLLDSQLTHTSSPSTLHCPDKIDFSTPHLLDLHTFTSFLRYSHHHYFVTMVETTAGSKKRIVGEFWREKVFLPPTAVHH
jgi:hypothetical protein